MSDAIRPEAIEVMQILDSLLGSPTHEQKLAIRRRQYAARRAARVPVSPEGLDAPLILAALAERGTEPEYDGPDNTAGGHEHWA